MTDRAGEEQLPRTDAEVAERDVAALQAEIMRLTDRLAQVEGERDEFRTKYHDAMEVLTQWSTLDKAEAIAKLAHAEQRLKEVEGERDAERAACAEGAHGAWEDVYRRLIGIYNRLTNKRWFIGVVRNSLQRTIKEHGPITPANLISAEKRIAGSILGEVLKEKQDATSLCSKCAHAEQRVAGLRELVQDMMWASGAGHAIEQYRERARTLLTPPPPTPETHHDMGGKIWTPEEEQ